MYSLWDRERWNFAFTVQSRSQQKNRRKRGKRTETVSYTHLVKDVGTMLEGKEAVKEGLIDEVGGMKEALAKLYELIEEKNKKN